jgi:ankyrin repeat protein
VCAGAAIDIQDKWDMDTPLHRATKEGHLETAQLLIQAGAHTTMWNMSEKGGIEVSPWCGRVDIRPVLTSYIESTWHATPLLKACYENDVEGLIKLLDGDPEEKIEPLSCSISDRDQYGWTALHVAVFMNCIEVSELLIFKGADVFAVTGACGHSVLHLACVRGNTEIFRMIISSLGYSEMCPQNITYALRWAADSFPVDKK